MVDLQVITPVNDPMEGVSSLTYPKSPIDPSTYICLDLHYLNKAIMGEHYKALTLDGITHKLSVIFSQIRCKGWLLEYTPGHPLLILNYM